MVNQPGNTSSSSQAPPPGPRIFQKPIASFTKLETRNGIARMIEEEETIEIPIEYQPDTTDPFYRPQTLTQSNKIHHFHSMATGKFVNLIAAKRPFNRELQPVMIRRFKLDILSSEETGFTQLQREKELSETIDHPNIVKFYEMYGEGPIEVPTHLCFVKERMPQTLEKYYASLLFRDEENGLVRRDLIQLKSLLTQILRALEYLHQCGIIHRDVSPRNIGIDQETFVVKLLDLGSAREINPKLDHSANLKTALIYKSLELYQRSKYNEGVDIWAAALVAVEFLGVKLMMPTGTPEEVATKLRKRGPENAMKDRIFAILGIPDDQYESIFGRKIFEKPQTAKFDEIWEKEIKDRLGSDNETLKGEDFKSLIKNMLNPDWMNRVTATNCFVEPFLLSPIEDAYRRNVEDASRLLMEIE
ncbi:unnamed protein product, partial [Mesorhabditis belari]|uniref:Protein kinase domain-containing protein n=1 Tax=Mesorhabditis belari TaxID=2138241 RepID=A0AAF3EVQ6_9BILA